MSEGSRADPNIDAVYYGEGASSALGMRVLRRARAAMVDLFMREMRPTPETRLLDIGVSDEENEGANFLEKSYPWPQKIVCAGLGNGEAVLRRYPGVTFRQIAPGEPLPFADDSFDIACSNAVIEHVGSAEARRAFIGEHLRVARAVFITLPNRWFPIEHHTSLPLLHFWPAFFRRALRGTRHAYWTDPAHVDFLDRASLSREWPAATPPRLIHTGIRLGPFSSNLAVIYRRPG